MRLLLTGAHGFLGWHVRCRLRAVPDVEVSALGRDDGGRLREQVARADIVLHLAGVNRGPTVGPGNAAAAAELADAVRLAPTPVRVVYADSTQAGNGSPYGEAKAAAAATLRSATDAVGGSFVDVRLPNLFGEHGRPDYNSFVATFCRDLARGRAPAVEDRPLTLLHAQDAAGCLLDACRSGSPGLVEPAGTATSVQAVLDLLAGFAQTYRAGELPDLTSAFSRDLFNTYRAVDAATPLPLPARTDARGTLVECVRVHGGGGQTFVSSSSRGVVRGEHFHLRKVERFVVLRGSARISLRRMFDGHVVDVPVSGAEAVAVDMPTMWAHSITNTGSGELVTLFWTDALFDPAAPDTYPELVEPARAA